MHELFAAVDLSIYGDKQAREQHEAWQTIAALRKREKRLENDAQFEGLNEAARKELKQGIPGFLEREFAKRCKKTRLTPSAFCREINAEYSDFEYYF